MSCCYRLLALDLDGTLLGPEKEISEALRTELSLLASRGIRYTIATGRLMASVAPYAQDLDIKDPVIACSGAVISCPRAGGDLHSWPLDPALIQELLEETEGTGLGRYLTWPSHMVTDSRDDEAVARYRQILGVRIIQTEDLLAYSDPAEEPALVLVVRGQPQELDQLEAKWSQGLSGRARTIRPFPHLLEVLSPEASKGIALSWLARYLDIPLGSVVAIGDGPGDVDMITTAGLGVAVANASGSVKARADLVTGGEHSAGVMEIVRCLLENARTEDHG